MMKEIFSVFPNKNTFFGGGGGGQKGFSLLLHFSQLHRIISIDVVKTNILNLKSLPIQQIFISVTDILYSIVSVGKKNS